MLFILDERIFLPITMMVIMVGQVGNISREKTRKELNELEKKVATLEENITTLAAGGLVAQ